MSLQKCKNLEPETSWPPPSGSRSILGGSLPRPPEYLHGTVRLPQAQSRSRPRAAAPCRPAAPRSAGREQLPDRDPRLVPLRHVRRGATEVDPQARAAREALELRLLDRALALQPADRSPAAHQPAQRLRLRLLQGGLLQLQPAPRRQGHRVRQDGAGALAAGPAAQHARLHDARARLAARAQPQDRHQPRLRQLPADGQAQRHALDAAHAEVRRCAPELLHAQRGGDALPLRQARRGRLDVAAHQRRQRRLQGARQRRWTRRAT